MPLSPPTDGYMHLSEPDGSNDVKFRGQPTVGQGVNVAGALVHFYGRDYPLGYAGESVGEEWTVEFLINATKDGADQWALLQTLLVTRRGRTLVWRTHAGDVVFVWLLDAKRSYVPHPSSLTNKLARVSLTLRRVQAV